MKLSKYFTYSMLAATLAFTACEKDSGSPAMDTTMGGTNSSEPGAGNSGTGKGGSMARFAIANNFLYTVDHEKINVFDIKNANAATFRGTFKVGNDVETIFPRANSLFIGSMSGMYIYDITNPANPSLLSNYRHIVACDPVVADENYAYVTLRSVQTRCGGRTTNVLEVIDVSDLRNPRMVESYNMTAPKGLGKDGNLLFVCDEGLKVMDATDPLKMKVINQFAIEANDLIAHNGLLMVIGYDGLYQYKYEEGSKELKLLSKMLVSPTL